MIDVKFVKKGRCADCGKRASKSINGTLYCPSCGDTALVVTIGKCIKGVEEATIKMSIRAKEK
jgi:Zn finger protein HypA/HybF involved in hydrogenase expression